MDDTSQHPSSPRDLAHAKRAAKQLRKQLAAGDAQAIARFRAVFSGRRAPDAATHADCLHIIAREAGAESWPRLKLAVETAAKGVTVNAVCPGYTDTEMMREAIAVIAAKTERSEDAARAVLTEANPQGRLVRPQEVAEAVAWLCLPASGAVTGQAVAVAGGEVM